MAGDLRNYAHRGVIPRAISHIFKEMDMRVDKLYKVHVSVLRVQCIGSCMTHFPLGPHATERNFLTSLRGTRHTHIS